MEKKSLQIFYNPANLEAWFTLFSHTQRDSVNIEEGSECNDMYLPPGVTINLPYIRGRNTKRRVPLPVAVPVKIVRAAKDLLLMLWLSIRKRAKSSTASNWRFSTFWAHSHTRSQAANRTSSLMLLSCPGDSSTSHWCCVYRYGHKDTIQTRVGLSTDKEHTGVLTPSADLLRSSVGKDDIWT